MNENKIKKSGVSLLDNILSISPIPIVGEIKFYKCLKVHLGYKPPSFIEDVMIPRSVFYAAYNVLHEAGIIIYNEIMGKL